MENMKKIKEAWNGLHTWVKWVIIVIVAGGILFLLKLIIDKYAIYIWFGILAISGVVGLIIEYNKRKKSRK